MSTPVKPPIELTNRIADLEAEVAALHAQVDAKAYEISSLKTSMEAMSALNQASGARYASELSRLQSEVDLANQRAQSSQSLRSPTVSERGDEDVDFGSSGDEAIGLLDTPPPTRSTPAQDGRHASAKGSTLKRQQRMSSDVEDDDDADDDYADGSGSAKLEALELHTASLQSAITQANQELDRLRSSKDDEIAELQARITLLEKSVVEKQQEVDDVRERLVVADQAKLDAERQHPAPAGVPHRVTEGDNAQIEEMQRENEVLRTRFIAAAEMAETASDHLNGLKAQVDHLSSQVMYLYTSRAEAFEKVTELQLQQEHHQQLQLADGVRMRADSADGGGGMVGPANGAALLMSSYPPMVDTRASTPTSARDGVVSNHLAVLNVPSPYRASGSDAAEEAVSRGQLDRALHAAITALSSCKEQLEVRSFPAV